MTEWKKRFHDRHTHKWIVYGDHRRVWVGHRRATNETTDAAEAVDAELHFCLFSHDDARNRNQIQKIWERVRFNKCNMLKSINVPADCEIRTYNIFLWQWDKGEGRKNYTHDTSTTNNDDGMGQWIKKEWTGKKERASEAGEAFDRTKIEKRKGREKRKKSKRIILDEMEPKAAFDGSIFYLVFFFPSLLLYILYCSLSKTK